MEGVDGRSLDVAKLPQVRDTRRALTGLAHPYPEFRHKWTACFRRYELAELDVPDQLWFCGRVSPGEELRVAIGGTRSPTVESFCLAADISRALAALGASIISGGVPGIDLAAHLGALDNPGSTTFAVLANPAGGGLRGHEWTSRSTQQAIVAGGGFLSEYEEFVPFGSDEHRERLLQRDRIISGLSDCFVAFECSSGSATVDTAKRALAQGKPVVCVVPPRRTERRGTDELAGDPRVTVLSSADGSADKIAFAVHELIGSTRHRSRIVGTAGG